MNEKQILTDEQIIAIRDKVGKRYNSVEYISGSGACEFARAILAAQQPDATPVISVPENVSGDVALPDLQDVLAEWFNAVDGEHQAFWENQIAKRIRTYGQQCSDAALERAAQAVLDRQSTAYGVDDEHACCAIAWSNCVHNCVVAIRALKGGE